MASSIVQTGACLRLFQTGIVTWKVRFVTAASTAAWMAAESDVEPGKSLGVKTFIGLLSIPQEVFADLKGFFHYTIVRAFLVK